MDVTLLSMKGHRAVRILQKYLNLCCENELEGLEQHEGE